MFLPDTQNQPDGRQVGIPAVGVAPVMMPLRFRDEVSATTTPVDAQVSLYTSLGPETKGTHLSRLVDALTEHSASPLTARALLDILETATGRLETNYGVISVRFRYYIQKAAPVTKIESPVPYGVQLIAAKNGRQSELGWRLDVPVTTLCPCSQAISQYGAHNQRGHLTAIMALKSAKRFPAIKEQLFQLEELGSCPIFTLLKRPDEKWVTETAFEHPKFVEDLLRDAVIHLRGNPDVSWFSIKVSNDESIHPHNAVAWYDNALGDPTTPRPSWSWWDLNA